MRIYCDFDGTITTTDTTDFVLERLARPAWRDLEAEWLAGRISAAECMRRQVALIESDDARLDAVLDEVTLTEGFAHFAQSCAASRVPLAVVSDGVDYFIRRILRRHGLEALPVMANRFAGGVAARRLEQPWLRADCRAGSGVCKCAATAGDQAGQIVYIGDGRSDFCVARRADLLIARSALARHAREHGLRFLPFTDFHDVLRHVDRHHLNRGERPLVTSAN
ncbi:MAG TPA: MtnX-like HAD-IB family phosphatase [Steroidobacteraceae bacterium]|nr:MtnX-like HAD-IB family phosphatase [Steroidobacteraceae bacterium]